MYSKFCVTKVFYSKVEFRKKTFFSAFSSGPPTDGSPGFSRGRGGGSAGRGGFNLGDNSQSGISAFNTVDPSSGSVQNQASNDNPFDNPNTQVSLENQIEAIGSFMN